MKGAFFTTLLHVKAAWLFHIHSYWKASNDIGLHFSICVWHRALNTDTHYTTCCFENGGKHRWIKEENKKRNRFWQRHLTQRCFQGTSTHWAHLLHWHLFHITAIICAIDCNDSCGCAGGRIKWSLIELYWLCHPSASGCVEGLALLPWGLLCPLGWLHLYNDTNSSPPKRLVRHARQMQKKTG